MIRIIIPLNNKQREAFANFSFDMAKASLISLGALFIGINGLGGIILILVTSIIVVGFLFLGYTLLKDIKK